MKTNLELLREIEEMNREIEQQDYIDSLIRFLCIFGFVSMVGLAIFNI